MERPYNQRLFLCALMTSGVIVNYLDRVNISHALPAIAEAFDLTTVQQGLVLSAFSWGYVGFMFFGGLCVDWFGPARVAGLAAAGWSVATAWTGMSTGPATLVASRLAVGVTEAPIFPANARLVRETIPQEMRGVAIAAFDSGSYVGTAVSAPIVVSLILLLGWRGSFLICAVLGMLWVAVWFRVAPRLVAQSRLHASRENRSSLQLKGLPQLLCHRRIVGASLAFFAYNYSKNFYLTWLPTYLIHERDIPFAQIGLIGILPPVAAVVGDLVGGWWTDRLLHSGHSVTLARKVPLCTGLLLGASIAFAPAFESNLNVIALLCFSFAWNSSAAPAIWALPGDFARTPDIVGTLGGVQNSVANVAGIVAPLITAAIVSHFGSFTVAIWVYGLMAAAGAVACLVLLDCVGPLPKS